ncbi:MAG: potassium channel family protein [Sedimentibacter sp.]|uniref:potassium channel family protein n=1 Tax=Sedimentibacter sp. TaxID=1960295 RepID=UPI0031596DED
MKKAYPRKENLGWVSSMRNQPIFLVLSKMLGIYVAVNLIFSVIYFNFRILRSSTPFFDYVYFSFVTSLSIGYGDLVPVTNLGKFLVILQSCTTALYFALMISVLSIKLLYPRNLIRFTEKIIYNAETDTLIFRVINTNKEPLINPEIRISVSEHNCGDSIPSIYCMAADNNITYLGKLDFSYTFKNTFENLNVYEESQKAAEFNSQNTELESRFRIHISLTGSYGMHQNATYKKYYAGDIICGRQFMPITYSRDVYIKKEITYSKIQNFWEDFEVVVK